MPVERHCAHQGEDGPGADNPATSPKTKLHALRGLILGPFTIPIVTKLEFESSQNPTKEFVQSECEKVLNKAAANDKERNQALLNLFDERLGAHRSAIITELERDLNSFKTDVLKMIEKVLHDQVPSAVKVEVDKIEQAKQAEAARERAEQEAKIQRYRNRIAFVGSCIVLLTALVTFYFSLA